MTAFPKGHPRTTARRPLVLAALPTITLLLISSSNPATAVEPDSQTLQLQFSDVVHPFLKNHCLSCHGKDKQEGKLDLSAYSTVPAMTKGFRTWQTVLERLEAGEMPPEVAKSQPTPQQRQAVVDWIKAFRKHEAQRNAGDPGPVLARRLNSAEYDYTIRDLTGIDIRPTREFPVDPANEAGFDNSGESLTMSPALLKKYLAAARLVADHLVLKPHGFDFAPHPVVTETDRDKYCVHRIIDFYRRQPTDLVDYFLAGARFKHRAAPSEPKATLADFATEQGVSGKYLATIWSTLEESKHDKGPLAELQALWQKLPAPDDKQRDAVEQQCEQMRDFVVTQRQALQPKIPNMNAKGFANGSQPMVLWKDRQYIANRLRYAGKPDAKGDEAALDAFCKIFPDTFYVSERDRVFLEPNEQNKGRLLSAGFHLMVGYFRDDGPLYQLILDEQQQRDLDNLWQELNFITSAPLRQYKDFIFSERAEGPRFIAEARFDFARSEDKDVTSQAKIDRLAEIYLAKAKELKPKDEAIQAIQDFFVNISADIRWVEQARLAAEPSHLESLLLFAERAYRRPLSVAERDDLLAFYRTLREKEGLSHEEALRDAVVSVLMSPYFCYRVDLPRTVDDKGSRNAMVPVSDYALAGRLSYFLWSSMPDTELLAHAAVGDLHQREVLLVQTRRMLHDQRIRGLAVEFGGNWLDFRRFEEHNGVDRERFQTFTNELREAMYEEPLRFFVDVARGNRSVHEFLYAKHTFVNPLLAKHYGMPISQTGDDEWTRVDDADRYGRGGLLPMAVFLTKNSPGLRTSPVKRGYWVIRRLLGESVPPPPPTVPELPKDEAETGDLTLRQLLAKHRDNKSCAGCHERFDAIGLVFEGFGPIGERRSKDLGGRPVDTQASFPGGSEGSGLDGLRTYLREQREKEFIDNLCRKLLAYALGRSLLLSDENTLQAMQTRLAADTYRFGSLVESIVTSPQFLNQRGPGYNP